MVVMEAAPSTSFEVGKAQFGFELFVVALDAPAQLGPIDETGKLDIFGQAREPVFGRFGFILGPIASSHSRGWDITFLQSRAATRTRKLAKREVRSAFDPSRQGAPGEGCERRRLAQGQILGRQGFLARRPEHGMRLNADGAFSPRR
jgi:hypothetical protein